MERSREGKRSASAPRRVRISCPKDPADAEARMDETPLIEKFKKGNLQALPVSFAAQGGTADAAWSKKKRHVLQEAQTLLERINVGNDSAEKAEMAPSDEEDDEAPLVPSYTPFGRSKCKERAKEDELVMDISNIPRRARSSSRISSLPRQLEPLSTGTSLQQASAAYQQRSPSSNLLVKRATGKKNRPLNDFRVMGSPQISDQEVEVAEVLFDLSRSIPSFSHPSKLMRQEKSVRDVEDEDFDSSSSQAAGSSASERLQKSSCPLDEPKSKRQRASFKQEETSDVAAAGLAAVDESQNKPNAASEDCGEKMSSDVVMDDCNGDSQLHVLDDNNANYPEQRSKGVAKPKVMKKNLTNNAEHITTQEGLASRGASTCKAGLCVQISCKDGECSKPITRSPEDQQANGLRSKPDFMCPLTNSRLEDEEEHAMEADNKRLALSESSSNFLRNGGVKVYSTMIESVSKENNILGLSAADVENESSICRLLANEGNQECFKDMSGASREEQTDHKLLEFSKEKEKVFDQGVHSACLSQCTMPSTSKSTSASTGFPQWGFYGKAAPPWLTNAISLGSSLGEKMSHTAIQLPHATAQHSVLRLRRCATHVYVAHYIQQRQQFLRQTFWPPACHSGAAYNPSTLAANLQGKDQWSDNDAYLSSMQIGCVTPVGSRMPNSRCSVTKNENAIPSNSVHGLPVDAGTGPNLGHAMSWGTHGQYAHAVTQRNGFVSVYMPSNKSPGQTAHTFDKSFYHAHSTPSELQSPAQKTSSSSHLPRHQQVPPSSSYVGLAHSLSTQPHSQLKRQVKQEQQQHYMTKASQHYEAGSEGFSGGDHMLSGKQSIQLHRQEQLQGQQAAPSSDTLLSHKFNRGPKVKDMNLVANENGLPGIPCKDMATVGLFESGFATAALVAKGHGGYDQQLQSLGTQQHHYYERSYPRAPAAVSTKSHHTKGQGFLVESQSPIKQAGNLTDVSKVMESHLPMSVVNSTCGEAVLKDQATGSCGPVSSLNGQLPNSHYIQKQVMAFVKPVTGANTTTGVSVENALVWANTGKTPPSLQQTISPSPNVAKTSHMPGIANGSHASSTPGQQAWTDMQSNNCASEPSSGTFSLCAVPSSSSSSSLKFAGNSGLSSTCSGEGVHPASQGGVLRKIATVSDPNSPSILNSGGKPLSSVWPQPQGCGQGQTIFPQQPSINLQQTRQQVYQQPLPSSDKQQQCVQQPLLQQQSRPSQHQQLLPQLQIQNSTLQQSHLQKQLQSPLNVTLPSGLLPSVTLGTISQGKTSSCISTGQANNEK